MRPAAPILVLNETRKTLLASRLCVAHPPADEPTAGTGVILPGDGLWAEACNRVDTSGMAASLDLLFLDADHRVVESITGIAPNTLSPEVSGAAGVLQLPAGTIPSTHTQIGDRILIESVVPARERAIHEGG